MIKERDEQACEGVPHALMACFLGIHRSIPPSFHAHLLGGHPARAVGSAGATCGRGRISPRVPEVPDLELRALFSLRKAPGPLRSETTGGFGLADLLRRDDVSLDPKKLPTILRNRSDRVRLHLEAPGW